MMCPPGLSIGNIHLKLCLSEHRVDNMKPLSLTSISKTVAPIGLIFYTSVIPVARSSDPDRDPDLDSIICLMIFHH